MSVPDLVLSDDQIDGIIELMNMGVGQSAASLSRLLNQSIELLIPSVKLIPTSEIFKESQANIDDNWIICIKMNFEGSLSGASAVIFKEQSGSNLISVLSGEDIGSSLDLTDDDMITLTEVGNIVINNTIGMLANEVNGQLEYGIPEFSRIQNKDLVKKLIEGGLDMPLVLLVETAFLVQEKEITGYIHYLLTTESIRTLLRAVDLVIG